MRSTNLQRFISKIARQIPVYQKKVKKKYKKDSTHVFRLPSLLILYAILDGVIFRYFCQGSFAPSN